MVITHGIIIVAAVIIFIWVMIEMKRFKHKLFAVFLILLIVASYFAFSSSFKSGEIDLTTMSGVGAAVKGYFKWFLGLFGNIKKITTYAVKLEWAKRNENKTT